MPNLQASGRTIATISFDASETAGLRDDEVRHLSYHIAQLLTGEPTAESEWVHLGIRVELEPDTDGGPED